MARKTKQEKIIADLRKRLRAQEAQSTLAPQPLLKTKEKTEIKRESQPLTETLSLSPDLIKKDLMKTILLSIVAISLELVLYLTWR